MISGILCVKSKPPDVQDPNDDEIDNPNTVKPIFLQDQDIFGSVKVTNFHLFFFVHYYYRKINCATNLHHLTSLLSLEKVDLCIFLERPLKEALAFKGRNSNSCEGEDEL
jgi:hypothetical protein